MEIKHYGIVERGIKKYFIPELYQQQVQALEGKRFVEIIREVKNKPTQSQFNYYRGGILPTCYSAEMFNHLDNKDKVHEFYFAKKFLTHIELFEFKGEKREIEVTRSLADLSDKEMTDFISRVLAECDELGITILSPDQYYNKFYTKK